MTNLQYGVEASVKVLEPLRNWVKNNVEKRKSPALKGAQPNGCAE
jgi:hypothetical protein